MTQSKRPANTPAHTALAGPADAKHNTPRCAPWFGNVAIMCGGVSIALLLAVGFWTDAGMGELTGGLRNNTLPGESAALLTPAGNLEIDLALNKNMR